VTEESQLNQNWLEEVEKRAVLIAEREGCILYDMEMVGIGNGRTLRIYIDKADQVGIEDCSNVSKGLNQILDEEDVVPGGPYSLEVSTPGIDRHLKRPWHFEKVIGKKIWVKLKSSLDQFGVEDKKWKSAKTVEQTLHKVSGNQIGFFLDFAGLATEVLIPMTAVEKAKVTFEMIKNDKNKHPHGNASAKKR
jgi:ribosome maturation factor RimP